MPEPDGVRSCYWAACVAFVLASGRKSSRTKVNQDAVLVTSLPSSAIDLYAVFDGHGPDGEKVTLTTNVCHM